MSFVSRQHVRFADCDPAGIAYYPRLLELVDAAIEDWTPYATGVSRRAMHQQHRLGLPTAKLATDFTRPVLQDDALDLAVGLGDIGVTSIKLTVDARCNGEPRFLARLTQVLIALDSGKPTPWPDGWRKQLISLR